MAQKIVGLDLGSYSIKAIVLESTYRGWELIGYHETKVGSGYIEAQSMIHLEDQSEEKAEESENTEGEDAETAESTEDTTNTNSEQDNEQNDEQEEWAGFDPNKERKRLAIKDFIGRYGADWDAIFTAFGGDIVSLKTLTTPNADAKQLDSIINFELEDSLPYSLSDKIFDYQILEKRADGNRILAGIIDKHGMEEYLAMFSSSGSEPKKIIIDALATGNLFEHLKIPEDEYQTRAIVDFGHRKTSVCVLKDGQTAFIRTIPFGGQDISQAIADELDIEFEDAQKKKHLEGFLASADTDPAAGQAVIASIIKKAISPLLLQLSLTLQAYTAETRDHVECIQLVGGSSKLNNLMPFLSEHFNLPASFFNYLEADFNRISETEDVAPEMASGLGIAFAGLSSRFKKLNFRKGDYAFKGDFEYWKGRIAHIGISSTAIFMFFMISIWSQFHVLGAEETKIADSIKESCNRILGASISDAKICISQMMSVISDKGSGGSKLVPEISVLQLFDEVSTLITADGVSVDIMELEITDKKIKLKGEVDTISAVGVIDDNLKKFHCFYNINQGPTRPNVKGDRVQFSLSILVDCSRKKTKSEKVVDQETGKDDKTQQAVDGDLKKSKAAPLTTPAKPATPKAATEKPSFKPPLDIVSPPPTKYKNAKGVLAK